MTKIENKIADFIQKHIMVIGFIALTVLALTLRFPMLDRKTGDYTGCLSYWIRLLAENGGFWGLRENIGEYNIPYMLYLAICSYLPWNDLYEIKVLSILFDFLAAFAAVKLVSHVCHTKLFSGKTLVAYAAILLNPVVYLNSAYWGQCDSIYVTFCLLCLYYILKEKHYTAMIFFGLAFAMKLQAIFFLPFLIIYYFQSRKLSIKHFLMVPLVFLLTLTPALIAGRGLADTLTIYVKQADIYHKLTMNCPNLYHLLPGEYKMFSAPGILLTLCILGIGACLLIHKSKKNVCPSASDLACLATWCSMVCIYFLPAMHERYPYIVCIFSIVYAFLRQKDWWIAFGINLVCMLSYAPYLFRTNLLEMKHLALINLVLLIVLTLRLFANKQEQDHDHGHDHGSEVIQEPEADSLSVQETTVQEIPQAETVSATTEIRQA